MEKNEKLELIIELISSDANFSIELEDKSTRLVKLLKDSGVVVKQKNNTRLYVEKSSSKDYYVLIYSDRLKGIFDLDDANVEYDKL